jgi:hypothetical protein
VLALGAAFASVAAPARSDDPAPAPVLPDLRQALPSDVKIAQIGGTWRLGFGSEVVNDGPGYLKITGNGNQPDGSGGYTPMVADQVVQMSDGTSTTVPGIGQMHYVIGGGHQHWHLLDFERYELRSAADPANTIVKDQKTGFCLADAFTTNNCGLNHPELTTVSEGIGAGGSDTYLGYLEGQYLLLDPATTPAGDYLLVNRVNPTGALSEANGSDNAASVRLALTWSNGTPGMTITNRCAASIDCPAPPPKPIPDPGPVADPQRSSDPQPIAEVVPTADPQPVPLVSPTQFSPASDKASLSRSMAGRLVRRAIQKSLDRYPRSLRSTCTRKGTLVFSCASSWRGAKRVQWTGRIRVWYRVQDSKLNWFYDLSAVSHPGSRRVVERGTRGSASSLAVFATASGALICTRIG